MSDTEQPKNEKPASKRRGIAKKILIGLVVVLIAIQFIPVDRSNPEVVADMEAPPHVKKILRESCYDCHSNETHWPWYSYVAPASWLVANDVHEGREYLNFSNWGEDYGNDDPEFTAEMFNDIVWPEIESHEMPLWFYIPLHPEAEINEEEFETLAQWCQGEMEEIEEIEETIFVREDEEIVEESESTEENSTEDADKESKTESDKTVEVNTDKPADSSAESDAETPDSNDDT